MAGDSVSPLLVGLSQDGDESFSKPQCQTVEVQLACINHKYDIVLAEHPRPKDSEPNKHVAKTSPSTIYIPPEIVVLFMYHAFPPSQLLDPGSARSLWSSWRVATQTKLACTFVDKTWSGVATEVLYREIVLHSDAQVPSLLRSLRDNIQLCRLVRSVCIACLEEDVPQGLVDDVQRILASCPLLDAVAIHPRANFFLPLIACLSINCRLMTSIDIVWAEVRRIFLFDNAETRPTRAVLAVEGVLRQCVNLSNLILKGFPISYYDGEHPLVLENLDTLYFDADFPAEPPKHWVLPKLLRLTLMNCRLAPRFLRANGGALEYLCMLDIHEENRIFAILHATCPRLQHFCIHAGDLLGIHAEDLLLLPTHPTIRFVDIIASMDSVAYVESKRLRMLLDFEREQRPNWNRRVRWIDSRLVDVACIPLLFPPDDGPAPGETIRHTIFQSTIIETSAELRLAQDEEAWPDEDSDEDSTYSYLSLDGYSEYSDDSEYWTDSDVSQSASSVSRRSSVSHA